MGNVIFGMSSFRNISFDYRDDDSGYSQEEWSEMSEKEQDEALAEYLWENVDVYVVED